MVQHLQQSGLKKVYVHHVVVEGSSYSITDDSREVEWVTGVPRISASGSRQIGRVIEFGKERAWGLDEHGRPARVLDHKFDPEEGRHLITLVAGQLVLTQKRPAGMTIWLVIAGSVIGVLAVAGVGVLFWALFFCCPRGRPDGLPVVLGPGRLRVGELDRPAGEPTTATTARSAGAVSTVCR